MRITTFTYNFQAALPILHT